MTSTSGESRLPSSSATATAAAAPCIQKCRSCIDCKCGENCQCTETLCRCEASSILNSLEPSFHQAAWSIDGMTCQSCVRTVQSVLGQDSVVSLAQGTARCDVPSAARARELTEELGQVGFPATLLSVAAESPTAARSAKTTWNAGETDDSSGGGTSSPLLRPPTTPNGGQDPLAPPPAAAAAAAACHDSPLLQIVQENSTPPLPSTQSVMELAIGGMTCTMCSKAVTRALETFDGVKDVRVNLSTDLATVQYDEAQVTTEQLQQAIQDIGYQVNSVVVTTSSSSSQQQQQQTSSKLEQVTQQQQLHVTQRKRAFLWSVVGTLPIFCITMVLPHLVSSSSPVRQWLSASITFVSGHTLRRESLLLWCLATPVQFGSGWTFYKTAYYSIFMTGQLGMDVLVVLGTTASYFYAFNETWSGNDGHFFETSAVLISFVLLGKWMNALAVRRTSEALTKLMKLQAKVAVRVVQMNERKSTSGDWNPDTDAYQEETVPIEQIQSGDMVKILRGAVIPADGIVSFGELTVDESMITGESIPVLKTPGSIVLGGTVCVEGSTAFVCVTGVGSSTALAQIVQLVEEAQTRQVPIQSLADQISSVFVPTVCTLSIITFLVWYALCNTGVVPQGWFAEEGAGTFSLMFGIACLVISCPCALGLATPTAVMVGTGVGASHGVLMKGGAALELASKVTSVVFDKTGTLTQGKPCITDFSILPGVEQEEQYLLWALASLERNSEHPLAAAVVAHAESKMERSYLESHPLVHPSNFRALTGRGASGVIEDVTVAVGNRGFAEMMELTISEHVEDRMVQLEQQGKTAILAAIDGKVSVVMGIADELKPDAAAAVQYLQDKMGVEVWMVTGDNSRTARAIADRLGLASDMVISEALPVAKVRQVRKLQKEGKVVAMIGDGINDSPALAQADVGMSLGTGAEIAAEASDMVLVRGHVMDVCTALDLSRVIFGRIQLNFVWSLIYNCLGIPIAAGAFYPLVRTRLPPTLAGLAMALSSLSVVGSSLALRLYHPPTLVNGTVMRSSDDGSTCGTHAIGCLSRWWRSGAGTTTRRQEGAESDLTQSLLANETSENAAVSEVEEGTRQ